MGTKYGTITFAGKSGEDYEFTVYSWDTEFKALGAVYLITKREAKPEGGGDHTRIYVGETSDLSTRFNNHHKAACFTRQKANCKCIHLEANQQTRLKVEADLINAYKPPCND